MRTIEPAAYLSTDQVRARFGGVSRMWVHRAVRSYGFPRSLKLGNRSVRGRAFYSRAEVERWERTQSNQSNQFRLVPDIGEGRRQAPVEKIPC